jgi:hypothetical protein
MGQFTEPKEMNTHAIRAAATVAAIARSHRTLDGLPVIINLPAIDGGLSAVMLSNPVHASRNLTVDNPALLAACLYVTAEGGRQVTLAP